MNKNIIVFLLVCFFSAGLSAAANDDRQIGNVMKDIERFEQQIAGKSSVRESNARRSLNLLKITRQRLDSITDQSNPLWIQADARFNSLHSQLSAFADGKVKSSSQANTQSGTQSGAMTNKPTAKTIASPASTAIAPGSSDKARTTPETVKAGSKPLLSYQVARIKKLKREIESATKTLDQDGPKPFQDSTYVSKYQKLSARFRQSLDKFAESAADPAVIATEDSLNKYNAMVQTGRDLAAKQSASLGDVQAVLRQMDTSMQQMKIPATPTYPIQKGRLDSWLNVLIDLRAQAIKVYQPLPNIKESAYLPLNRGTVQSGAPYDRHDVDRLDRGLRDTVDKIDKAVKTFTLNLNLNVDDVAKGLAVYEKFDPTDKSDRTNHFLAAGRADKIRAELTADLVLVGEAASYSKRLKHQNYSERVALLDKIRASQQLYESNLKKAYGRSVMPKAASTDPKLISIAQETLANPEYKSVGKIKRLVINSDKVHRSMDTTNTSIDKVDLRSSGKLSLSGTSTTYHFEWDQFQVATAEAVGDKYFIFFNTLKYYTSGGTTTPLNRWIMSDRIQSSEILEANIDK